MNNLIYLASPYSDPDPAVCEARFQAACRAAAELIRLGYAVFSPIAHSHPIAMIGGIDHLSPVWYEADLPLLHACSRVIVLKLDGWDTSRGVSIEERIAREMEKPVMYMEPV